MVGWAGAGAGTVISCVSGGAACFLRGADDADVGAMGLTGAGVRVRTGSGSARKTKDSSRRRSARVTQRAAMSNNAA
jgi:hypothetical protein